MTIVEKTSTGTLTITAGIDTHADFHVAAAIDHNGFRSVTKLSR